MARKITDRTRLTLIDAHVAELASLRAGEEPRDMVDVLEGIGDHLFTEDDDEPIGEAHNGE